MSGTAERTKFKPWSVDYWRQAPPYGDPDRTDFFDDETAARNADEAVKDRQTEFAASILHQRVGESPETPNWNPIKT
jgi:hypothetical protein